MLKVCTKCKVEKEADKSNFYWRKESNKFRDECILCHKKKRDEYREENRDKINKRKKIHRSNNKDYYKKRAKEYRAINHDKILKQEKLSYFRNKDNKLKSCKKYTEKNKDIVKNKNREYYIKNRDILIAKSKEYIKNNKLTVNARKNKWEKNKKLQDKSFKLRKIVSVTIKMALKKQKAFKNGSCKKYLPYSLEKLKLHLESQFESWMSWKNHGIYNSKTWDDNNSSTWTWNIDHIIPQSDLPYDSMEHENFKKCWALENLRPYSAKQNILDGTNRIRHKKATNAL